MSGAGNEVQISLNSEEKRLYGQLFKQCDPEGLGIVTGEVARTLFERTGLPPNVLGEIWQIADVENQGFLNQVGFSLALRVIGHVQNGAQVSSSLGEQQGPLPRFDTPQRQSSQTHSQPPIVAPNPVSAGSVPRVPALNPTDRARFVGLFDKSAPTGMLDGEQAKNIFLKAKLPNETLGQIWNLSDIEGRGSLNQTEFVVAMHLIQCVLNGSMKQLPETLPPPLFDAASGRTPRGASPRVSSSSSNRQFQQPVNRQFTGGSIGSGHRQPIGPASADWQISPKERQRFDSIFNNLDAQKRGLIGADEVVPFLKTSKLSEDVLAQVWDLADVNNTGEFGKNEFAIAMYLVQQKISGRELPNVLPQSLLYNDTSRQGSLSSPTNANAPNPAFFAQDTASVQQPGSRSVSQQHTAPSASTNTSSMNDLASLNDLFSSPPPSAQAPKPAQQTQPSSQQQQQPLQSPKQEQIKQFVPTSSFGQSITKQDTSRQSPQVTGSQVTGSQQTGDKDLLAAEDSDVSKQLSQATTEFANLSNQIGSLTTQSVGLTDKREKAEAELARTLGKKKDIEAKLASLRTNYDAEVRKVQEVEQMLETARKETDSLTRDFNVLDASFNALRSQYDEASGNLTASQQENANLKEKIRSTNEQISSLKETLENVQKEAKQQRNMVAINEKQLATSTEEKEGLEKDLRQAQEQVAAPAAPPTDAQEQPKELEQEQIPAQNTGNPFFAGNFGGVAAAPPPTAQNEQIFNEARQREFEETFGRMEVASPSTAEPARSSTHNTVDTPNSSPPASDFQYNTENQTTPGFTLPLARPESATSSVQNNPPQSVRGELDVSRPESPDETSQPVSGIVPPENFPEIEPPQTNVEAPAAPVTTDPLRQASLATLTPEDEEVFAPAGTSAAAAAAAAATTAKQEDNEERHSSESYEMVSAGVGSGSEKETANDDFASTSIPGGFPPSEAANSETSTRDWAENQKFNTEFPPVHEVEKFDESSSDEEGPEDIMKNKKPVDSQFTDEDRASSTQATTGGTELSAPPTAESISSSTDHSFASARSSPATTSAVPTVIAATTSNDASSTPPSVPTPKPDQQSRQVSDPFASAFSGLSEAKEEKGTNPSDDFEFNDNFDDFQATIDHAFNSELNGNSSASLDFPSASQTAAAPTSSSSAAPANDEWEQLFAGFSSNNQNQAASPDEVNDAFKVTQTQPQPPVAAPPAQDRLTPHSEAVKELVGMGFSEQDSREALEKKKYNLAEATNYLLDK